MKPNQDIRDLLKEKRIFLWQVARKLNIHEQTLYSWLRYEPMPMEHQVKIFDAIDEIERERYGEP